ncbi:hypothetical protein LCGC14_1103520 [marine sediment metagenome]|uniref:Uncharacterized protein n=1 Tax=marine sediment metagenome TaxID=412755 RepID=A0A0F9M8T9_9ZZZZ
MYQIHTTDTQHLIISRDGQPNHALTLTDVSDLLLLRQRINAYIDDLTPDGTIDADHPLAALNRISTVQARAIAADKGLHLPATTLNSALHYGHITGAIKRGNRWFMDRHQFKNWLDTWHEHAS